jgi:D-serine deaminase-like pyridoxal phosphate-dependent protein
MSTEATPIIDTNTRRRILTEALDLTIARHVRRARQLRTAARSWHGKHAAMLRAKAEGEDQLRRKAELLKEEINR